MFTDFISYFESLKQIYAPVAGLIEPVAAMSESFKIIDLCSGGGSPAVTVMNASKPEIASRMEITLTDKYPNLAAFKSISDKSDGKIKYIAEPVDALTPPEYLKGFRTIFSAFHHFDKASAAAILADTVEKRQGIGIFEYTDRSMVKFLIPFGIAVQLWLLFKFSFLKPFDWRRLLWTFLIPVLPAMVFWDGFVSCMRTYSVKELEELIMPFSDCGYSWKTGRMESSLPFYITYLIGYPED
ncbi:MAG TPA: hypothetical protein VIS94_11840 [Desulfomonilia bacterium]